MLIALPPAQLAQGQVQDLVDQAVRELLDVRLSARGALGGELARRPLALGPPQVVQQVPQLADDATHVVVLQVADAGADRDLEQLLGTLGLAAPLVLGLRHDPLQVVDVVKIDVVELAHAGLEVAGHRDVDDAERAPAPPPRHGPEALRGDDRPGRAGAADHDVRLGEQRAQVLPRPDDLARGPGQLERLRQRLGAAGGSVHQPQPGGRERPDVAERHLHHLPRADGEHGLVIEPAEHLADEVHRDGAHGQPALVDARLPPDPLRGADRFLEQVMHRRARGGVGA